MPNERRGVPYRQAGLMRVDNALVEEVSAPSRSHGSLLISYAVPGPSNLSFVEQLQLNIRPGTLVLNALGRPVCFCDIRPGTWIDAFFSPMRTRSIPPQSAAFLIAVRRSAQGPAAVQLTVGPVASVNPEQNLLFVGDRWNPERQTRFVLTDTAVVSSRDDTPISLGSLRPGQLVRVTHSTAQTASIPPQSTAYQVQVL